MRYLKIDVEVKLLNLQAGENMTEEFLKINPQHCVPTVSGTLLEGTWVYQQL